MAAQTSDRGAVDPGETEGDHADQTDEEQTDELEEPTTADLDVGPDAAELDLDDVFHILQNERRRQVLLRLKDVEGTVRMREIAERIAAWENDTTVDNLYSDQRQRVYIALYQSHLPKLDDLGVIEYNQSRGTIEPTPLVDEVVQYLEPATDDSGGMTVTVPEPEQAWAPAAAAGGAVGVLILTAALAGLFPTSLLGVALATVVLGITAVVAVGLSWTE